MFVSGTYKLLGIKVQFQDIKFGTGPFPAHDPYVTTPWATFPDATSSGYNTYLYEKMKSATDFWEDASKGSYSFNLSTGVGSGFSPNVIPTVYTALHDIQAYASGTYDLSSEVSGYAISQGYPLYNPTSAPSGYHGYVIFTSALSYDQFKYIDPSFDEKWRLLNWAKPPKTYTLGTITVPGVEQETFRLNGSLTKQLGKALGFDYLEASPRNVISGSFGVGFFGIMGSGEFLGLSPNDVVRGRNPSYPSAFTRSQGGWYPITEISESTFNVRLYDPKSFTSGTLVKISHPTKSYEYFLLEYRQAIGYDAGLAPGLTTTTPGNTAQGLLIWHIDETAPNFTNITNYPYRNKVALQQKDGFYEIELNENRGNSEDPYPGSIVKIYWYNDATDPSSSWYSGASYFSVSIPRDFSYNDYFDIDIGLDQPISVLYTENIDLSDRPGFTGSGFDTSGALTSAITDCSTGPCILGCLSGSGAHTVVDYPNTVDFYLGNPSNYNLVGVESKSIVNTIPIMDSFQPSIYDTTSASEWIVASNSSLIKKFSFNDLAAGFTDLDLISGGINAFAANDNFLWAARNANSPLGSAAISIYRGSGSLLSRINTGTYLCDYLYADLFKNSSVWAALRNTQAPYDSLLARYKTATQTFSLTLVSGGGVLSGAITSGFKNTLSGSFFFGNSYINRGITQHPISGTLFAAYQAGSGNNLVFTLDSFSPTVASGWELGSGALKGLDLTHYASGLCFAIASDVYKYDLNGILDRNYYISGGLASGLNIDSNNSAWVINGNNIINLDLDSGGIVQLGTGDTLAAWGNFIQKVHPIICAGTEFNILASGIAGTQIFTSGGVTYDVTFPISSFHSSASIQGPFWLGEVPITVAQEQLNAIISGCQCYFNDTRNFISLKSIAPANLTWKNP